MFQAEEYRAYTETSVVGMSPISLVTSLYEGAIGTIAEIRGCFAANDIPGRTKAVNKVISILTELMLSLNHERGGEISANLKRLYSYMQCRVLESHTRKDPAPLDEVERLLKNLLESWYTVAQQNSPSGALVVSSQHALMQAQPEPPTEVRDFPYGGYFAEAGESVLGQAFSF